MIYVDISAGYITWIDWEFPAFELENMLWIKDWLKCLLTRAECSADNDFEDELSDIPSIWGLFQYEYPICPV